MVCAGIQDLLIIMPTGHGKSLCFLIPAKLYPQRTIIVVVPLTILMQGHLESAHAHGVTSTTWNTQTDSHATSQLVFVSSEHATCSQFIKFAQTLFTNGKLHLLVFDEIHLLFSDFRQKMGDMGAIRRIGVKIVMLTATLPPSMEKDLRAKLYFEDLHTLRMSTVRPNVFYNIIHTRNNKALFKMLLQTLVNTHLDTDDRVIVYFFSTKEVDKHKLAIDVLNDADPHSGLLKSKIGVVYSCMTAEKKTTELAEWRSGKHPILFATPVIGCGYDYPSVRLVVHYGMAYDMLAFHQQSGRLSRDGKKGTSIVLANKQYYSHVLKTLDKSSSLSKIKEFNNVYVQNAQTHCYRQLIHRIVDEDVVNCFTTKGALLCGNCEKLKARLDAHHAHGMQHNEQISTFTREIHHEDSGNAIDENVSIQILDQSESIRAQKEHEITTTQFELFMEYTKHNRDCLRCLFIAKQQHGHHLPIQCPQMKNRCFRCYDTKYCNKNYTVEEGCRFCGLPQLFHTALKYAMGTKCQSEKAEEMRIVIWFSFRNNMSFKTHFDLHNYDDGRFFQWLLKNESKRTYNN